MTFEEWRRTAPEAKFEMDKSPMDYAESAWDAAWKEATGEDADQATAVRLARLTEASQPFADAVEPEDVGRAKALDCRRNHIRLVRVSDEQWEKLAEVVNAKVADS